MTGPVPPSLSRRLATAEACVALAGIALIVLALLLTQGWLDRHLLPSFYVLRRWYVFLESSARVALAGLGLILLLGVRRRLARLAVHRPSAVVAGDWSGEVRVWELREGKRLGSLSANPARAHPLPTQTAAAGP